MVYRTFVLWLIVVNLVLTTKAFAQEEFSFVLHAQDAQGNHDSVIIGYDPLATDSIDAAFGESAMNNIPWNTVFDLRLVNLYFDEDTAITHKKQIVEYDCDSVNYCWANIPFFCYAKYMPVTFSVSGIETGVNTYCTKGAEIHFAFSYFNIGQFNFQHVNEYCAGTYPSFDFIDTVCMMGSIQLCDSMKQYLKNDNLQLNEVISLYPNPTSGVVHVDGASGIKADISVFDVTGQKIMGKSMDAATKISLNNFPDGIYIFLIRTNQGVLRKKIVKTSSSF